MSPPVDRAGPARAGEKLDTARLEPWLRDHAPGGDGPLEIEQFPAGHSNLTYLLRRGSQELVLRRPPFGNRVKTAHDMSREFRVLSRLSGAYAPAPRPVAECADEVVIGAPFYVMERRRGIILRGPSPAGLPDDPRAVARLCESFVEAFAALHALDASAVGWGRPEGYVARQVEGWTRRYADARTHDLPEMERAASWMEAHRPVESGAAIIHNDFKYDNLVLDAGDPTRIVAVLDWEMATVGDPLMDLGATLSYWIDPSDPEEMRAAAFGPTLAPGSLTRRELLRRYEERTGRRVGDPLFYYVYGLHRLAVILQQIYARYAGGATKDARFASLHERVAALARRAVAAIEGGSI